MGENFNNDCVKCSTLQQELDTAVDLQKKHEQLYEQAYQKLQSSNNEIQKLREDILKYQKQEQNLESEKKMLENSLFKQENKSRTSQTSLRMMRSGISPNKDNMAQEFLQKIMKLEETNKKLNRKVKFLTKEINDAEGIFQERLEILYLAALGLNNTLPLK